MVVRGWPPLGRASVRFARERSGGGGSLPGSLCSGGVRGVPGRWQGCSQWVCALVRSLGSRRMFRGLGKEGEAGGHGTTVWCRK